MLLAAGQRALDEAGRSRGTACRRAPRRPGSRARARDLDERRRHVLEAEPDAEAERGHARLLERRHERPLRLRVAAQPHAGREHHPVARQPARRLVDLDGMRPAHLAARRIPARRVTSVSPKGSSASTSPRHSPGLVASGTTGAESMDPLVDAPKPRARVWRIRRLPGAARPPKTWRPHDPGGTHDPRRDQARAAQEQARREQERAARGDRRAERRRRRGVPRAVPARREAARLPGGDRGRRRPLPLPRGDGAHLSPTRRSCSRTRSRRASASRRASPGARARARAGSWSRSGGAIVRFADGQIAECWNLPAQVHAVAS